MAFTGWPTEAVEFYEGLEADNSKGYWTANKDVYEQAVKGPFEDLCAEVDEAFRPLKLFRPYRDVRFSKDKTPYKTSAAAASESEGGSVYYVQLSATGLLAGTGQYHMAADQLERFRAAVDDERTGRAIERIVAALATVRYDIAAHDELKTAPRGYAKDHPRIGLLRRKGLIAAQSWPVSAWLHTAKAKARVEASWRGCDELNGWLATHVGPSEMAPDERSVR